MKTNNPSSRAFDAANDSPRQCRYVLSFDGGGIRGTASAQYLAEALKDKDTGKYIKCFLEKSAVLTGTSAGSSIAAGLAFGMKPEDLVSSASEIANTVFGKMTSLERNLYRVTQLIQGKPIYDSTVLQESLGKVFGKDTKLGDTRKTLLIPACREDLSASSSATFCVNRAVKQSEKDELIVDMRDKTAKEICSMSMSAPIYFNPTSGYADGGLAANDPILQGCLESQRLYPGEKMAVLSIGTGVVQSNIAESIKDLLPIMERVNCGDHKSARDLVKSNLADGLYGKQRSELTGKERDEVRHKSQEFLSLLKHCQLPANNPLSTLAAAVERAFAITMQSQQDLAKSEMITRGFNQDAYRVQFNLPEKIGLDEWNDKNEALLKEVARKQFQSSKGELLSFLQNHVSRRDLTELREKEERERKSNHRARLMMSRGEGQQHSEENTGCVPSRSSCRLM